MEGSEQLTARAARSAKIGRVAARQVTRRAVGAVREPFMSEQERARARDEQMLRLADDLAATLGSMKGAAMKLGQVLSLLNFGLSSETSREEFTRRMGPLFSQGPAADNAVMHRTLEREWGSLGERRVASVEPTPIATASLGQVYRATLVDGTTVAVKVQYPWVRDAVRADLKNLALFVRLRRPVYPLRGLNAVVREVSKQIELELDYRQELANHRAVYEAYRNHPVFVVPEPIDDLCTDRVLVTEYVAGTELHHLGTAEQGLRDHVGEAIHRFYCGSLYTTGNFCADPHPGNILVLPDGRVAFLDFGLYVRMSGDEIDLERAVLAAVLAGDAETAHRLACEAEFILDAESMLPDKALAYMRAVAGWFLTPGVNRVTDKVAYKAVTAAMSPRSQFGILQQQMLSAHAFSRRTEMSVCALLGTIEAAGPWHDIVCEWALGAPPATDMGRRIAEWSSERGRAGIDAVRVTAIGSRTR